MKKKEKDLVKQQKKEERKARRRRERGEDTGAITASSKAPSEMTDGEEEPDDGIPLSQLGLYSHPSGWQIL